MTTNSLTQFCRTAEVMLRSGLPIHKVLQVLESSAGEKEEIVYQNLLRKLESGHTLSRSMASCGSHFPPLFISCIALAEDSGRMVAIFEGLADFLERRDQAKGKLIAALVYPSMLFLLTIVVVLGIVFFVLPKEAEFLESLGAEMPLVTKFLVSSVEWLTQPSVVLLTIVGMATLAFVIKTQGAQALKNEFDLLLIKAPLVGPVIFKMNALLLLRGLAVLIDSGATIPQGLSKLKSSVTNSYLKTSLEVCIQEIEQGESPSTSFAKWQILPPVQNSLIRFAEEVGQFDRCCHNGAKILEEDLQFQLETLSSLLEPAALMFMALVVGFVVLSTALPTAQLMQSL